MSWTSPFICALALSALPRSTACAHPTASSGTTGSTRMPSLCAAYATMGDAELLASTPPDGPTRTFSRAAYATMSDAELLASTPIFALARRDEALRARITADWANVGVSHVRFVDALVPTDPADARHACVAAHDVSSVGCPAVREVMAKRVGQTCSQVWRLQSAVLCAGAPAAIILEDDVILRPNRTAFRSLLPRLLRALHAREAGGREWDVAFLGSCFERLNQVSRCEELSAADGPNSMEVHSPYRLWLSDAARPLCMHGLVMTLRAARLLRESMSAWLARYYATVQRYYANSTSERGAPACEGIRWVKGMAFAINGHDLPLMKALQKQTLKGLHVWPQLIEQASKVCALLMRPWPRCRD